MGIKKTGSQLKQSARGILLGNYGKAISLIVFSNLTINTLVLLFPRSKPGSITGMIIEYLIYFFLISISCIFQLGIYSFYLNLVCQRETSFKDLFLGFSLFPEKTVISQLLIILISFLFYLPGLLLILVFYFQNNYRYAFYGFLLFLAALPFTVWINLAYSQCYFILLDFPDTSAMDLLKKSARLMRGNKTRLLLLQISFLPMLLLGILSFGIGLLFVSPYQSMTYTLFYLDLVQNRQ